MGGATAGPGDLLEVEVGPLDRHLAGRSADIGDFALADQECLEGAGPLLGEGGEFGR